MQLSPLEIDQVKKDLTYYAKLTSFHYFETRIKTKAKTISTEQIIGLELNNIPILKDYFVPKLGVTETIFTIKEALNKLD